MVSVSVTVLAESIGQFGFGLVWVSDLNKNSGFGHTLVTSSIHLRLIETSHSKSIYRNLLVSLFFIESILLITIFVVEGYLYL